MYCKNCGFHSFDHLKNCPKCDQNWEQTRKDLGLQWIKETKGNWLEPLEGTEKAPDSSTQKAAASAKESFLHATKDDFLFEEDWPIIASGMQENLSGQGDDLDFPEKAAATSTPRHTPPELLLSQSKIHKTNPADAPMDDLLIPGLEEMLQASEQTPPLQSPQLQSDLNDVNLALTDKANAPEVKSSTKLLRDQEEKNLPGISAQKIFPAPVADVQGDTPHTKDLKKDTAQDIVEINLEDLEFSLDEETAPANKKGPNKS